MLDIKFIRDNTKLVKQNCVNRLIKVSIDQLLTLDVQRRDFQQQIDVLRAERNKKSKGKPNDEEIVRMREIGDRIREFEQHQTEIENEYRQLLLQVPNMTHPDSPIGNEDNFRVVEENGTIPQFDFEPKDHEQLMTQRDLIDFERGAKVAGSKFYFVKNDMVRLNMALINYGLDVVTNYGYIMLETPDVAKQEVLMGAGYNPRGEEKQIYNIEGENLSLVATAEIPVLGYHADEILDLSEGPKKYVALSHCFRMEAGAYGRTSKGLYRVHQFTKLEMFVFCKPEESEKYHEELLTIEKEICNGLEIPYRVIDIASGDLGGPAYRKYDLEAYMVMNGSASSPQGGYGEITSTSNCTDYQARRMNIRHKNQKGETEYVHTLNGTAIVLSRFPIAIIENYQQKDGSIKVPKILHNYVGKKKI